jgi:DNA repair ATPase RecN
MEELSDMEENQDSREVLSHHYKELSEAFNNSKEKECLEEEFKTLMNQFTVQARGTAALVPSCVGQNILMLLASSRKFKTHGTQHH